MKLLLSRCFSRFSRLKIILLRANFTRIIRINVWKRGTLQTMARMSGKNGFQVSTATVRQKREREREIESEYGRCFIVRLMETELERGRKVLFHSAWRSIYSRVKFIDCKFPGKFRTSRMTYVLRLDPPLTFCNRIHFYLWERKRERESSRL